MKRYFIVGILVLSVCLSGCGKMGFSGTVGHLVGNWAEVQLPQGCKVKQMAAEEGNGVVVLCEDGRVFH